MSSDQRSTDRPPAAARRADILAAVEEAFGHPSSSGPSDRTRGRPDLPAPADSANRSPDAVEDGPTPADADTMAAELRVPETDSTSPLFSPDPETRREAVAEVRDAATAATEEVGAVLLKDPDPGIRRMAVDAMAQSARGMPIDLMARGLQDPDDGVRAAVVRAAEKAGAVVLPLLVSTVAARRWPMAQDTALRAFPELIGLPPGLADVDLLALLSAVAAMEPPPIGHERVRFGSIARAIGRDRLLACVERPGPVRLGAVRLLIIEGSPDWIRPLAALAGDPLEEVRRAAAMAATLPPPPEPTGPSEPSDMAPGRDLEQTGEEELVSALARGLTDPDPSVRQAARSALATVRRMSVVAWARRTLVRGSDESAGVAAALVEAMMLVECRREVLARACATPPESRGPLLGAMAALSLPPTELVDLAAESDPAHRQEAVRLAWQVGGRRILGPMKTLLQDSAGAVRMAVLEIFRESGEPSGFELADAALRGDSSAAVRATAAHGLALAPLGVRLEALARTLADPDPDVRATAVDVLAARAGGRAGELLLRAIRDPDERVWQAAMRRLVSLPEEDLDVLWTAIREGAPHKREEMAGWIERTSRDRLATLADRHARSADRADRALAIEIAARAGTAAATQVVVAALEDPDPLVRRAAATSMSVLRTPAAVPALSRVLSDPQTDVRVEAVRALGLIDDDGVPPLLVSTLKDPEIRVREMAGEALTRSRSPAVARLLAAALSSPDVRRQAGDLLEHMGEAAVEPLVDVVIRGDADAAAAAGAVLERVTGPQTFVAGLSSLDPDERLRAAEVLGVLGGPTASEALLTALLDPDQRVRSRVIQMLGDLGDPRAVEPLRRTLRIDPVAEVVAAAEEALRALGAIPSDDDGEPSGPAFG